MRSLPVIFFSRFSTSDGKKYQSKARKQLKFKRKDDQSILGTRIFPDLYGFCRWYKLSKERRFSE